MRDHMQDIDAMLTEIFIQNLNLAQKPSPHPPSSPPLPRKKIGKCVKVRHQDKVYASLPIHDPAHHHPSAQP